MSESLGFVGHWTNKKSGNAFIGQANFNNKKSSEMLQHVTLLRGSWRKVKNIKKGVKCRYTDYRF